MERLQAFCISKFFPGFFLIIVLEFIIGQAALSQDRIPISFGKVGAGDFGLPNSPCIDSNTSAVIIGDLGNTGFVGNRYGWVSYVFKRHTRIKILNKKGVDAATVKVNLYHNDKDAERMDDIEAVSYNLENGVVTETKLQKKDVFEEAVTPNRTQKKFTMPAVKDGTIIEYSYTITSVFYYSIPTWDFQNAHYPCLWSEYNIVTPSLVIYTIAKQGVHPYFIDKAGQGQESYRIKENQESLNASDMRNEFVVNATTYKHQWVMRDVPAFYTENYINTPQDYIDKIEFQLAQTFDGENTHDVDNSWTKATQSLLSDPNFGQTYQTDHFFDTKELDQITDAENELLEKIKKVYYFVRDHYTCTSNYSIYAKHPLEKVYAQKNGNVAEINLLLVNLLRKNGFHADPVLLSTREYGINLPSYPLLERLNYVVCWVYFKDQVYYLDASRPTLGFAILAQDCYNGHARIICMKDSASVFFYATDINEQRVASVMILNDEKKPGFVSANCQINPGYFSSVELRTKIRKEGEKDLFQSIQKSFGSDWQISGQGIDSINNLQVPVKIHFDASTNLAEGHDLLYFNPIVTDRYTENIFKAASRKYPVEMPYPLDQTYILSMELPDGYAVEELPKSAKVSYNGNDGFFEYLVQKEDSSIQLRARIKLNKATFSADEYNTLRDFFGYVVKKENEQFVFRKKK